MDVMDTDPAWYEQDEFWKTCEHFLFPPESFEEAREQVEKLTEMLGLEPPARVLDMPSGVGRHAVSLADRGFAVTAVDRTEHYLQAIDEQAAMVVGDVECVCADMREFAGDGSYDVVLNLFSSFGYFADREEDKLVAQNFYKSLTPGGRLVVDMNGKEILANDFHSRTWHEADGSYLLEECHLTDGWSWMENRWIVIREGEIRTFDVSHRLYSGYELAEVLRQAGFANVSLFGSFDGDPYDQDAERLIAIAEK